jgi:hypothetical protein
MRPIIPNTKNDLRKIHDAITDLTKVVSEIKSMLMKGNDEKKYN